MITELSKDQINQLEVYKNKWLEIGLDTKRSNRQAAEQAAKDAYKEAKLEEPKLFIWVDSPLAGCIAAKLMKEISEKYKTYDMAQVGAQVRDQVWAQVRDQVWAQVRDQVGAQVGAQVWAQVRDQVWAQVRDQGLRNEYNDVYFWGSQDAGWLSFYSYFLEVCQLGICKRLIPLMTLSKECGWIWFYKNCVIFTEKPTEIHRNSEHRLHNFNGLSVKYADGTGVYAINGLRVPEYICTQSEFTKEQILKEENADFRRAIIQKIGIEKTIEILGADILDTYECPIGGKYELLGIDYLGDGEKRPYLKMWNPSINSFHIEGVRGKTVKEALCFRNGLKQWEAPSVLS